MKKYVKTLLAAAAATLMAGAACADTITIKVANYFAAEHPQNVALREKFKPMVEKNSGGTLKVNIFENNKLGGEQQFYTGVRNGTIDMGLPGMIMQADVPRMGVPEWPFMLRDFKHAKAVLQGPIGKELAEDLEKTHGVHVLAWSVNGFRMFSTSKPLETWDDFKNIRMRMPNTPVYVKMGQALGMTVSPMPLSEVFTAMEQKVVDGQDNPIATVRASGFYEVQNQIFESRHSFSPNVLIVSKKLWGKLTPEQKKVVEDAAAAYADYQWQLAESGYETDKKFLQEHKMKFVTPDAELRRKMETATAPVLDEYYAKYPWAKDLVARVKAAN
ncbi:TRAP transporter substrate-binding protein [Paracandidimonas lactea]|uniref:TRAP transporter substrate-binding protein n=1 Tax=Paracandidimonas lactea TaxID=2895524 RepID=UPI0019267948